MSVAAVLIGLVSAVLPGEAAYLAGHAAERARDYEIARGAYRECARLNGPLAPYAAIRAAVCQSYTDDDLDCLISLRIVLSTHPKGPWVPWAEYETARALVALDRNIEAGELFAKALEADYDLWWLGRYRWTAAENTLSVARTREKGLDFFRQVVESTPYASLRLDAARLLLESTQAGDRMLAVTGMMRSRAYKEVRRGAASAQEALEIAPEFRPQWAYVSAQLLIAKGDESAGLEGLQEMQTDYPDSPWTRSALLLALGRRVRSKTFDAAEELLGQLVAHHPGSSEIVEARWQLGRAYAKAEEYPAAITHFDTIAQNHAAHRRATEALLQLGAIHLRLENTEEALRTYDALVETRPGNVLESEGAFRAGTVLLNTGSKRDAASRFRIAVRNGVGTYYGHRAQDRLVRLNEAVRLPSSRRMLRVHRTTSLVAPIPMESSSVFIPTDPHEDDARYARLNFFGRHGLREAEWEALGLLQQDFEDDHEFAAVLQAVGESGVSYSAMQVAFDRNWGDTGDGRQTLKRLRVRFPRAYWPLVVAYGDDTQIDPYLLLSIARQESTYRPSLTSSAGAKGIMQLMPGTATQLARKNDAVTRADMKNLTDPVVSFKLGAHYLRQLLDRFDGNVVYALAAYNAGPKRCEKWIKEFGTEDVADFIEQIPYTETRNYVKRILGYYAAYHSLYPEAT
ncbi:MAG: transglycosylase SLT domain-containing protein [Candidatus Hydrogenedentes bacterium]|nr:transglycosylase SLT domain-containing protein [Candidatus Hydrogenedentota bacterium]